MSIITNLVTSWGGIAGIAAGVIWFLTAIAPVLPPAWGNLIAAILGVIALYQHGKTVSESRAV